MTPAKLNERLMGRIEAVCAYLLPGGKRQGHEWVSGSVAGEAGESLKVSLAGGKTGVWSDFATNETGGDLLDLWCAARRVDLRQAMSEAASFLGIVLDGRESCPRRTYRRPDRPREIHKLKAEGAAIAYLKSRGITEATIAAYRIAEQPGSLRWPELKNNPGTLVFPLMREGVLLNCKYLAIARGPDGRKYTQQEAGAESCLFGWQAIPENTRSVAICEGEIDAMTLHQFGIWALSVPSGAADLRWIESDYDHLMRFDTIFVCTDNDEPGRSCAAEIIKRLGPERCRLVELPYKDANECLMQGGFGKAEFAKYFMAARTLDPEELKSPSRFADLVLCEFYPAPEAPRGLYTPWRKVGDALLFRPAETTLWTGYNGCGKSVLLSHIAASGMDQGARFCIASLEMPARRTLYRMVRQLSALREPAPGYIKACLAWLEEKLWLFDVVGSAKTERLLEVFGYAVCRYAIRHFVIDSLAKLGLAEDDYNGQKAIVERLCDFAHRHESHVHLVAHARKGADEYGVPGKMDVKGTGALTDLVDNVVTVWRNKRKEKTRAEAEMQGDEAPCDQDEKPDAALVISKQRHSGWEGQIWLWFDPNSLQYLERVNSMPIAQVPYSNGILGVVNR